MPMANLNKVLEAYVDAFPDAEFPDSRAMSPDDFNRLDEIMQAALDRGSPIDFEKDLEYVPPESDFENGMYF